MFTVRFSQSDTNGELTLLEFAVSLVTHQILTLREGIPDQTQEEISGAGRKQFPTLRMNVGVDGLSYTQLELHELQVRWLENSKSAAGSNYIKHSFLVVMTLKILTSCIAIYVYWDRFLCYIVM